MRPPKIYDLFYLFFLYSHCFSTGLFPENLQTMYFEQGSPLVTEQFLKSLNFGSTYTLFPRYTVLESEFTKTEENVYLKIDDIVRNTFHLYESKFPDYQNYKISIFNTSMVVIAKCKNYNSCEVLEDCIEASIEDEEIGGNQLPLPDNIVYISWKKMLWRLFLLVQYKAKITRCGDFNNHIDIKKVVIQSNTRRNFAYTKYEVLTTTKYTQIQSGNFSLKKGESVYVRALHSSYCLMKLLLTCGNETNRNEIQLSADQGPRVSFSNDFFTFGWKKIEMSLKKQTTFNNCTLIMHGCYNETKPVDSNGSWTATCHITISATQTKKKDNLSHKHTRTENCSCINNLVLYLGISFILTVLVSIFICWCRKKKTLKI